MFTVRQFLDLNRPTQSASTIVVGYGVVTESRLHQLVRQQNQVSDRPCRTES